MTKKLEYKYVKELFESDDYALLSKEYKNSGSKLEVQCPNGHIIKMTVDSFKDGNRCKFCALEKQKLTYSYVKNFIENIGYTLLSEEYNSVKEKLDLICSNGHHIQMTFNQINAGRRCKKCFFEKRTLSYDFVKEQIELEGYKLISETYVTSGALLQMICPEGHIINLSYNNFRIGIRCRKCSFKIVGENNTKRHIEHVGSLQETHSKIASEWHPTKNGNLTPKDVSYGCLKKVWWICPNGHKDYYTSVATRTGGSGCPICKESEGEDAIRLFLENKNIDYEGEYRISACRNKRTLPFDFAVWKDEKFYLIEYHGIQHYQSVKYFGGQKKFEERQINDRIKKDYCIKNNLKLIEIPYWDFYNIESVLTKELNLN